MRSKLLAGVIAGLLAGFVFGLFMSTLPASTAADPPRVMMHLIAGLVRSDSLVVGWLVHLAISMVLGGLFGVLFGRAVCGHGRGALAGALYGLAWYGLGSLILTPILLGLPAFAPLNVGSMRPMAMTSLVGHFVYGLILGGAYVTLTCNREEGRTTTTYRRAA